MARSHSLGLILLSRTNRYFLAAPPVRDLSTVAQTDSRETDEILGLSFFGFLGSRLLCCSLFAMAHPPSVHLGSREADMARSRRRERTRTNKNAPRYIHGRGVPGRRQWGP